MLLLTVGHGTLDEAGFSDLLTAAGVELLVDVRTYPGSRRHPHFSSDAMPGWLPVEYRWERRLGGRRRPVAGTPHVALRNEAFRGYADHMETEPFRTALAEVLEASASARTAVMCSESLWWRCHRRLLSDSAVLLHGVEVEHLFHDGRLGPHAVTDGARVGEGVVVYDVVAEPTLPGI